MNVRIGYLTVPDRATGLELSRGLVKNRLVACANMLGPVTSVYEWEGTLEETDEWTLLVKTVGGREAGVEAFIQEQHPYDCPCLLWLDPAGGLPGYLEWVRTQVDSGE